MNQKELINSIKGLKEIKPRQEWVVFAKAQILSGGQVNVVKVQANKASILEVLSAVFFQRKLAYSSAAFAFVVAGLVGFAGSTVPGDLLFPIKKIEEQSTAVLSGQNSVKQSMATLNSRINDLAQVTKEGKKANIPSAIDEVNADVTALTKNLKANPVSDTATLKEIAVSLKTLADVSGSDASTSPEVTDLYQTIDQAQIDSLQKATLTDDQKITLAEIEDLYKQEKYADTLEKILTINTTTSTEATSTEEIK